jgi:hypothetical protein
MLPLWLHCLRRFENERFRRSKALDPLWREWSWIDDYRRQNALGLLAME